MKVRPYGSGSWEGQGCTLWKQARQEREVIRPGALTPTRLSVPLQCDRMAADHAQELPRHGVSYVLPVAGDGADRAAEGAHDEGGGNKP